MPDRIQSYKVVCEGGLNSTENHLYLAESAPGAATRLVNYEVSLYGGYRRIEGYKPYDESFPEVGAGTCEGPVLSVAIFKNSTTQTTEIICARKNIGSDTYSLWKHVELVGWQQLDLGGITRDSTNGTSGYRLRIRTAEFNFNGTNHIVFVDGLNSALVYDGTIFYEITPSGTGVQPTTNGDTTSAGGPNCPAAPSLVSVFKNRLFIGGDITTPSQVSYSSPLTVYDFTAGLGAGYVQVGFDVVQFKPFRDNLYVFGSNSISRIEDTGDADLPFAIQPVTANVGCVARDSVLEIGGDLLFLAPDGFRPVAGTSRIGDVELETVSRQIQSVVANLGARYDFDNIVGTVIRSKSQVRYFFDDDSTAVNNSFGIIGGLRSATTQLQWEFGQLLGIRAYCATSEYVGREEIVLHGDYDGVLYQQEQGNDFAGENILSLYQTPYYDFGDTEVRKTMRKVNTFIRAEGPFEMNMSVSYDWSDPRTSAPGTYVASSTGQPVLYGGLNIEYAGENIRYGGSEKPIIQSDIQGSGYAVQLTFVSLDNSEPFTLQGFVFEFSIAGRR